LQVTRQVTVGVACIGNLASNVRDNSVKGIFSWKFQPAEVDDDGLATESTMKRIAIIAFVAAGLAAPALAADLSRGPITKAPPAVAAAFSWTGCHIGGHIGGAVSEETTTNAAGVSISHDSPGFVGGGQLGCDYQFASRWVVGIEGRADGVDLKNSRAATVRNLATGIVIPSQFSVSHDFLASATARLGYSFAERWLVYVRGGAAWTREKTDDAFTNLRGIAVDPNATLSRSGWTAGAGVDWAFARHWSATLEYDYYDFGTAGVRLIDSANNVSVSGLSLKDTIHAVTAGVNYHF
jgi:outer membrane immunogenic protein